MVVQVEPTIDELVETERLDAESVALALAEVDDVEREAVMGINGSIATKGEIMENKFERVEVASPSEAAENKRALMRELSKSDTVYVMRGKDPDRWACKSEGLLINVISHCERGTFVVDVPTGIKIGDGEEVESFAYANHLQVFKYKTGEFVAIDEDGNEAWAAGSELHLRFEHIIRKQEVGDIVHTAASTVDDCKETLAGVANGRTGLEEAVRGKNRMSGLERLLGCIGS